MGVVEQKSRKMERMKLLSVLQIAESNASVLSKSAAGYYSLYFTTGSRHFLRDQSARTIVGNLS
jgi:hypothetical protein